MGREERQGISRIKLENLPRMGQTDGKGEGSLVGKERLTNGSVRVTVGPWISFVIPYGNFVWF